MGHRTRITGGSSHGDLVSTGSLFSDPGSPWQNGFIESFNSRLRDEHLNGNLFDSLTEAKILLADFQVDYNKNRPHSAHGWKTPEAFAENWITKHQQLA